MKLIHAGNVCIGGAVPEFEDLPVDLQTQREDDIRRLIRTCEEEQVDLLLFSGNLFEHSPSEEELAALDSELEALTHTRVFIVTGMKDSGTDRDPYSGHTWKSRVMTFAGDSLQRVYVSEAQAEITCCGYNEKTWEKVHPEKVQPGKKGRYQILLLPFLGENDSEEALAAFLDAYQLPAYDYVAIGNNVTRCSEGSPVHSIRAMEADDFEEVQTTGIFKAELTNEKKPGNRLSASLVPVTENPLAVLKIKLDPEMRFSDVERELKQAIASQGKEKAYRAIVTGRPSIQVYYLLKDLLRDCGNVAEIIDRTEDVSEEAAGNEVLKRFAEEISLLPAGKVRTAAFRCGIQALLEEQERAE